MINASNITNYNQSTQELQESLLFWILAAGKNGTRAANIVNKLVKFLNKYYPNKSLFSQLQNYPLEELERMFVFYGTGCQHIKARCVYEVIRLNLNLCTCSSEELETCYGIGKKTARCFILHSRYNAQYAGLDTHVLKFLDTMGVQNVPKNTPSSRKVYNELEKKFLNFAKKFNKTPAELDLEIWNTFKQ